MFNQLIAVNLHEKLVIAKGTEIEVVTKLNELFTKEEIDRNIRIFGLSFEYKYVARLELPLDVPVNPQAVFPICITPALMETQTQD